MLVFILLAPSVVWIARDRAVWPWDQAWYGEVSVELYRTMIEQPGHWLDSMLAAIGAKPPGIAWLGMWFVPIGRHVFGRIEPALLLSILLCQAGTLALLLRMGRRLVPGRPLVAIVPCVMVAAAPLFVGMSHQYFAEPLQILAVAWTFSIASRGCAIGRLEALAQLVTVAALGMLAKMTTPIYCLLPGLLAVISFFRQRPTTETQPVRRMVLNIALLLVGFVLVVGTIGWYTHNAEQAYNHAAHASSGEAAQLYGSSKPFIEKLGFWSEALRFSFIAQPLVWVLGAAGGIAMVAGLVRAARNHTWKPSLFDMLAIIAAVHVLVALSLFSLAVNEETRFLIPLAVPLAILLMRALAVFPDWSLASLLLALFVGQWGVVHAQAQGWIPPLPTLSAWLRTVDGETVRAKEVDELVRLTSDERTRGSIHTIGVEYPWFNANSFSFYAAKAALDGVPRCYYTSLGYAEKDGEAAWNRLLNVIRSPYFISIDAACQPPEDAFNVVSQAVLRRINPDERFVRRFFESHVGAVLYQRTEAPGLPTGP